MTAITATEKFHVSVVDLVDSKAIYDSIAEYDALLADITALRTTYPDATRYKIIWRPVQVA